MASRPGLDVWLYGTMVGRLTEPKYGKIRFDFSDDSQRRFRSGSVVFSVSMPISTNRRPRGDITKAFFDGLLPEGDARDSISDRFSVTRGDNFGLVSAIGRDCAGAVVIQPSDLPEPPSGAGVEILADRDLERLISQIKERPLGADDRVRVSLPGAQEKLVLSKTADGVWARPVGGAPSTHILKPQDMRLDSYAAGEVFCLGLARRLGLTTVESEVIDVAGRPVCVVSRYDRELTPEGTMRIHQEDICQALAVDCSNRSGRKYQAEGGPSLHDVADVLSAFAPLSERTKLLALAVTNVVVGNADAHAKNISLLHPPDGTVVLAPAYDITPTTFYRGVPTPDGPTDLSDRLAMWINNKQSIHDVTAEDLVAEGSSWGIPEPTAERLVTTTIADIIRYSGAVDAECPIPAEMLDFIAQRAKALGDGAAAGAPPTRRLHRSMPVRRFGVRIPPSL